MIYKHSSDKVTNQEITCERKLFNLTTGLKGQKAFVAETKEHYPRRRRYIMASVFLVTSVSCSPQLGFGYNGLTLFERKSAHRIKLISQQIILNIILLQLESTMGSYFIETWLAKRFRFDIITIEVPFYKINLKSNLGVLLLSSLIETVINLRPKYIVLLLSHYYFRFGYY